MAPAQKPQGTASPAGLPADATQSAHPTVIVTHITFDVLRVRVPAGLLSESGKVWNHVDTGFLPAETVKHLHRNGLRAARGDADAWPPIRAILETAPGVESSQSSLQMSNGLPFLLELDRPRDQILFLYRRDGTLAGAPWRATTNLLRIEYGIAPTDADALLMEIMPELRLDSPAAQTLHGAERWDHNAPVSDRTLVVRDLAFRVELGPGQFLALGPSSVTGKLPYVMGSLLLCEEMDGDKFESMYFLTPTISRTGAG